MEIQSTFILLFTSFYRCHFNGTMFDVIILLQYIWQYVKILGITLAPVVQTLDSAIHQIKIYPVDDAIVFANTYPLDSDLSGG